MLDSTGNDTGAIYSRRFDADIQFREELWRILCRDFFQRFIPRGAVVLELAAGYCEFINNIDAKHKIAIDINEETRYRANPEVQVILTSSVNLSAVPDGTIDIVFVSNFFEHICKTDITKTLRECHRILRQEGRILILRPNIRFLPNDYWRFFDHITPIDDRALCEILVVLGFEVRLLLPRFLPFTTKIRLPRWAALIRLYLKFPVLYRFFGKQAFVVAQKWALQPNPGVKL